MRGSAGGGRGTAGRGAPRTLLPRNTHSQHWCTLLVVNLLLQAAAPVSAAASNRHILMPQQTRLRLATGPRLQQWRGGGLAGRPPRTGRYQCCRPAENYILQTRGTRILERAPPGLPRNEASFRRKNNYQNGRDCREPPKTWIWLLWK